MGSSITGLFPCAQDVAATMSGNLYRCGLLGGESREAMEMAIQTPGAHYWSRPGKYVGAKEQAVGSCIWSKKCTSMVTKTRSGSVFEFSALVHAAMTATDFASIAAFV